MPFMLELTLEELKEVRFALYVAKMEMQGDEEVAESVDRKIGVLIENKFKSLATEAGWIKET